MTAKPRKRCLLWDWKNTCGDGDQPNVAWAMDNINFEGPFSSVSNWNTWIPPELKERLPFRPMIHLENNLTGNDWAIIQDTPWEIIQYFNEPERAGITPERAAEIWQKQIVPLKTEKQKKFVSPACASDPQGTEWIRSYLNLTKEDPPDYLGLHYYGANVKAAIEYLEDMHARFPDLPVFVSEIASISRNKDEVFEFTEKLCRYMDSQDWIFEYAWFCPMPKLADDFVSPAARLMNEDGSFTELMEKLMSPNGV